MKRTSAAPNFGAANSSLVVSRRPFRPFRPSREPKLFGRALGWLAFLGPLFFLTYGFANWHTGRLPHVGSVVFAWEKHIPFLQWTIVPYMSIDAFYAVSLFLCASRAELDAHARRLLCATLISVAAFLLFPLKFSFDRPPVEGFNGALFNLLTSFDKPFNQAPSLHISLLMLLWAVYRRHLRGTAPRLLWLLHTWFFLIGVSVLTTYQHHAIDVLTGLAVGVLCLYLFPDAPRSWQSGFAAGQYSRKLQWIYHSGAVMCALVAWGFGECRGWAWLLLWPAFALFLVGIAYAGAGAAVFQKHEGRLSLPARLLLAPYRLAAWFSSRWYTRHGLPSSEVVPGVWIGRAPSLRDWRHLDPRAVLDLTAEFNSRPRSSRHDRSMPLLDMMTPSIEQLDMAVAAMDEMSGERPLLVHCALGYSRSALVVAAWLLRHGLAPTPEEAVARVRAARPQIVIRAESAAALDAYFHAMSTRKAV